MQSSVADTAIPAIVELVRGASHLTCGFGNVVVSYSRQSPEPGYLDVTARAMNEYAKAHPSGLGMLVLISVEEPPPDEATRQALLSMRRAVRANLRASVLVVEGEGFLAAAKRSVVAMLSLASSESYPTRVAGNISEGAGKLTKLLGPRLEPQLDATTVAAAALRVRGMLT